MNEKIKPFYNKVKTQGKANAWANFKWYWSCLCREGKLSYSRTTRTTHYPSKMLEMDYYVDETVIDIAPKNVLSICYTHFCDKLPVGTMRIEREHQLCLEYHIYGQGGNPLQRKVMIHKTDFEKNFEANKSKILDFFKAIQ